MGLDEMIVAETRLSEVDGQAGQLIVAGLPVAEVAERGWLGAAALLLGTDRESLRATLGEARRVAFASLSRLGDALDSEDGMDAMRAAMAHGAPDRAALLGAPPVYVAAWWRGRQGLAPVAPEPEREPAEDLLRMLRGSPATTKEARALDAYLATVAEHGMNASTFAARVVASTESDDRSAVVAAIGALKGRLHGGAPGPVLDMLDAIGEPAAAEAWVERELEAGRRIMGMGHRVYRARDPRAAVLERWVEELGGQELGAQELEAQELEAQELEAQAPRIALARAIETTSERLLARRHPDRPLRANVEFYTAVLLEALGIDRRLFTPVFSVGRVAGWLAHVAEQRATGRLLRPRARYVGDRPAA